MASPFWVTGDPTGPVAPVGLKYGPHPDHDLYVWDPNPSVVPEGGYPCCVTVHGGGNKSGSGFSSSSAVPLGWASAAGGQWSWEWNAENFPMMVCPITYPMGMSLWAGLGNRARPLNWHNEPVTSWRAVQRAIQWVKSRARRKIAPFQNVNPDLVYGYGTSAGATWLGMAAFGPSDAVHAWGETSQLPFVVMSSMAVDVNEHVPSVSGTEFMLNNYPRWFFRGTSAQDELAAEGGHPSIREQLAASLARDPDRYKNIGILSVYALNSNPTPEPPWRRAHDAGQGVAFHRWLEANAQYTGAHRHLANSQIASGAGESDVDDELPDEPWAFEWGLGGVPGYQLQWEWITEQLVALGAKGDPVPPDQPNVSINPIDDAYLLQGGGFIVKQDGLFGYLLQDDDAGGGGGGPTPDDPTGAAYLLQDGTGYLLAEGADIDGTELHFLKQESGRGTSSALTLLQDGTLILQQDGFSAYELQSAT